MYTYISIECKSSVSCCLHFSAFLACSLGMNSSNLPFFGNPRQCCVSALLLLNQDGIGNGFAFRARLSARFF